MNFFFTDSIELLCSLFVDHFIACRLSLLLFYLLSNFQGWIVEIAMIVRAITFYLFGVCFQNLFVLFYQGQFPLFSTIYMFICFIDTVSTYLVFHLLFSIWFCKLICVFCYNKLNLLWREKLGKLIGFRYFLKLS